MNGSWEFDAPSFGHGQSDATSIEGALQAEAHWAGGLPSERPPHPGIYHSAKAAMVGGPQSLMSGAYEMPDAAPDVLSKEGWFGASFAPHQMQTTPIAGPYFAARLMAHSRAIEADTVVSRCPEPPVRHDTGVDSGLPQVWRFRSCPRDDSELRHGWPQELRHFDGWGPVEGPPIEWDSPAASPPNTPPCLPRVLNQTSREEPMSQREKAEPVLSKTTRLLPAADGSVARYTKGLLSKLAEPSEPKTPPRSVSRGRGPRSTSDTRDLKQEMDDLIHGLESVGGLGSPTPQSPCPETLPANTGAQMRALEAKDAAEVAQEGSVALGGELHDLKKEMQELTDRLHVLKSFSDQVCQHGDGTVSNQELLRSCAAPLTTLKVTSACAPGRA